ncbi:MAG: hypothetical protein NVS9B2_15860 [Steroidobacteraceae bacterium]
MSVALNAATGLEHGQRGGIARERKGDGIVIPLLLVFIWAGLLFGFIPRVYQHFSQHKPPYLWVTHIHNVAFVGWMILFTAQIALVRGKNFGLHRRLGKLAYYLAPVMIIAGSVTQFMVSRSRFGTARWDPPFLAVPLADLVNFGLLLAFAIRMRNNGAAHKRLMLLASSAIANVGFSRWWGPALKQWFGNGFVSQMAQDYLGSFVIIVALLAYDITVRGRPTRPVVIGGALIVGIETLAIYLYLSPWWFHITDGILHP